MPPQSPPQMPAPPTPSPVPPLAPPTNPTNTVPDPQSQYGFITGSDAPPANKPAINLPGGNSMTFRILYAAGGLLVLLILFIFVKGLLSGSSNLPLFVTVAQDQQELIHLATNASQQQGLTTPDQNFAATARLSLGSSQAGIIKYLTTHGKKLNTKTLNLKVSTTTDTQLTNSVAATTYDQTFQSVMKSKLTAYAIDLKQAYKQTTGPKGRTLLSGDYDQSQLLLLQLSSTSQ